MTHIKKQMKITKLFNRGRTQVPDDCEDIQEEIQQLEQKLKEKHDTLFSLQRNSHRQRYTDDYISKKSTVEETTGFTRPQKIILTNSVETFIRDIELMSLLSGVEVQSYEADDHCAVLYHMQHASEHALTHGLKIDMKSGENKVSSSCLPLGFNLNAVLEQFNNVMLPGCLVAVRRALAAYYDRLEQFQKLKELLRQLQQEGRVIKLLDGSHIEISFSARSEMEAEDEHLAVTLMLDYRVHDIRPKHYSFVEIDLPEDAKEALGHQCAVFKRKPLHKAFRDAFVDGVGPYTMVPQDGVQSVYRAPRRKRPRQPNPYNNNDDTFHPEDCSSEDDVEE